MSDADRPALRIVRGEPSAEEVAVLAALVSASGAESERARPEPARGRWNDPRHQLERTLWPGPGGWRASGR